MANSVIPKGFNSRAHEHWQANSRQLAIDTVLEAINAAGPKKPLPLILQLAYYVFLVGDPAAAAIFLERSRADYPDNPELLRNLAVCLSRSGQHEAAVERVTELLAIAPEDFVALDALCNCLSRLGRFAEAAAAGTRSLLLKDRRCRPPASSWRLPAESPAARLSAAGKIDAISFSLWGRNPRYLRGALDNALAASQHYPGWSTRFHVDDTVPADLVAALRSLGADIRQEAPGQALRQKLAWRFKVANDPEVGRFLVRDIDSVVNARERTAVDEWIASDRWFHVMRDWWTHTDLVLAGMWGGVAGVLPALEPMLRSYQPPAAETPNIDQWFLRDQVWGYIRGSCLIHDRCFDGAGARRWPGPATEGSVHVGQDVFAAARAEQASRLGPWLTRLSCL